MTRVRDLFDVSYGHSLELNRLNRSVAPGAINFVSRTAKNNGVSAKVECIPNLEPASEGLITVALGGSVLETFVQPAPFYTGFHVAVLAPLAPMTLAQKLYWVACIRANRYRFNYGRQANRTLADLELPSTVPDWVKVTAVPDFSALRTAASFGSPPTINASAWQSFRYEDIFDIVCGDFVSPAAMKPGTTPFVQATRYNNGVARRVTPLPVRLHEAGAITVAGVGSAGEAFYQPQPFHASNNVLVLRPRCKMSREASLFVCTLIRAEKYRYSYGRVWSQGRMKQSVMRLPVTADGEPDWGLMERFVVALPYSSFGRSPRIAVFADGRLAQ